MKIKKQDGKTILKNKALQTTDSHQRATQQITPPPSKVGGGDQMLRFK